MEDQQILASVNWLIDDWCEVRMLGALRHVLPVHPPAQPGGTDWIRLREALRHVERDCAQGLSTREAENLKSLLAALERKSAA